MLNETKIGKMGFSPIMLVRVFLCLCVLVIKCPEAWAGQEYSNTCSFVCSSSTKSLVHELSFFERNIDDAPEILSAIADLEQNIALLDEEQATCGLKVFGGIHAGEYEEAVTDTTKRSYERLNLAVGIRYPLFGSLNEERRAIFEAEQRITESRFQKEITKNKTMQALRACYINYWSAQEKANLTLAFLDTKEETEKVLAERMRAGFLFDSDCRELMSAYTLAERRLASMNIIAKRALGVLQLVVKNELKPFEASYPVLPQPISDMFTFLSVIKNCHPELLYLRSRVSESEKGMNLNRFSSINAHFNVTSHVSQDYPSRQNGYGATAGISFELPFGFKKASEAHERANLASLNKLREELKYKSRDITLQAEKIFNEYYRSKINLKFASQRLQVEQERVREKLLRSMYLPGDVMEQLQSARIKYYYAACDYVDAQSQKLILQSRLLAFASSESGQVFSVEPIQQNDAVIRENLLKENPFQGNSLVPQEDQECSPSQKVGKDTLKLAVYVWNSRELLEQMYDNAAFWDETQAEGINRLLVSLDAAQIEDILFLQATKAWQALCEDATIRGIQVDLLLGEPLWILPEFRDRLITIVKKLSFLPFNSLQLDLEPNQLDSTAYDEDYILDQLLETLAAVRAVSPWPLGLSIHPRYAVAKRNGVTFLSNLAALDIKEIVLMIYSTNPRRVAEITTPLIAEFPSIRFSIAQSVEPFLSVEESYASKGRRHFVDSMRTLKAILPGENTPMIVVQSWKDYRNLKP